MPSASELSPLVEAAFRDRSLLSSSAHSDAVVATIAELDRGALRVATRESDGTWTTHAWVKEAILLYFALRRMEVTSLGPFEFHDKIPLKRGLEAAGVRVVPPGVARYGSFLERGVILMPGYVNVGARVHLSGGVGIGGVLEPPQAQPVIVEDGAFLGSRAIVTEGVRIGREAVLAANVSLTRSVPVIDVTGPEPVEYRGEVPPRAIVVPGTRPKEFPAGTYQLDCALIIGYRAESHDQRLSLNDVLREYEIAT